MKKLLSILAIVYLVSCGLGNYDFETTASYQANNSNLTTNLSATGYVPSGADVGEGNVNGIITGTNLIDTIHFQINSTESSLLIYNSEQIEITNSMDFSKALTDLLTKIGVDYDRLEIQELGKVIIATTSGPKGTYMEGQTDFIKVINVVFKR